MRYEGVLAARAGAEFMKILVGKGGDETAGPVGQQQT
jgi:hypothetical protein